MPEIKPLPRNLALKPLPEVLVSGCPLRLSHAMFLLSSSLLPIVSRLTYLNGVLALREVNRTLLCLLQGHRTLGLAETSADGTGLFWAEIERHVLFVLVEEAELGALVGVNDCEDLGDRLADIVAAERILISSLLIFSSTSSRFVYI